MSSKEEYQKKFKQLTKALECPMDCDKCDQTEKECLINIRICLNLLFRNELQKFRKYKRNNKKANALVS